MKTFPLILILVICLSGIFSTSMAQQSVFNKVYYDDVQGFHVLAADKTPDHGFIMVGRHYDCSGHIVKIDSAGSVDWVRLLNGPGVYGELSDVLSNPDSTIVTAGKVYPLSDALIEIIKWDKNGDTLWTRNFNGLESMQDIRITKSSDGSYLIVASNSNSYTLSNFSTLVLKLNENGELMWSKTYTSDEYYIFYNCVRELPDHDVILSGYRRNRESNEIDLLITKTDENGNVIWSEALTETGDYISSEAIDMVVNQDGIVIFLDLYDNSGLIKLDFDGNPVWAKNYYMPVSPMWTDSKGKVSLSSDGGFILVSAGWGDGQFLKTDASGVPQWLQAVFMYVADVAQSDDGGYMVFGNGPVIGVKAVPDFIPHIGVYKTDETGNSLNCVYPLIQQLQQYTAVFENFIVQSSDHGAESGTLLTINSSSLMVADTCVAFTGGTENLNIPENTLRLFPNPTSGFFSIDFTEDYNPDFCYLEIITQEGRKIFSISDPSCLRNGINPGYLPEGIYLVRLSTDNEIYSGKLLIKH